MRVLGMSCASASAFLAVAEDGVLVPVDLERFDSVPLGEVSERLVDVLEDLRRLLAEIRPDLVCLLLPENNPRYKRSYAEWAPRMTLETLVRLAAVQSRLPVDVLARVTVRSRLGLPSTGPLHSHVAALVPEPVGGQWKEKRDVAALAALAGGKAS